MRKHVSRAAQKMSKVFRYRVLHLTLLLLVANMPMIILSIYAYIDPFMYNDVGYSQMLLKHGRLIDPKVEYIAFLHTFYASFMLVTDIQLNLFLFTPYMGPLLLIALYCISKRILNNFIFKKDKPHLSLPPTLVIFSVLLLESYGFLSAYYNFWRHSIGTYLFFTFLLMLTIICNTTSEIGTSGSVILLVLVSVSLIRYDYTASTWMLITLTAFYVSLYIISKTRDIKASLIKIVNMTFICTVVYWSFNIVVYEYMKNVLGNTASTLLENILTTLTEFLFGRYFGLNIHNEFTFTFERPWFIRLANLVYYIVLSFIVLRSLVHSFMSLFKNKHNKINKRVCIYALTLSLGAAMVLDTIGYIIEGYFSLRSLAFFGPLYILLYIEVCGSRNNTLGSIKKYSVYIIITLTALLVLWYSHIFIIRDFVYSQSMYKEVDICASFTTSFMSFDQQVCGYPSYTSGPIGDHHTMGRLYTIAASKGLCSDFQLINYKVLYALIHNQTVSKNQLIIINTDMKMLYGLNWAIYRQPTYKEYILIYRNTHLYKIYDGKLLILYCRD